MTHRPTPPPAGLALDLEHRRARLAMRLAAGLTEQAAEVHPDVSVRLRHAREQAIERARTARLAAQRTTAGSAVAAGGSTAAWGGPPSFWFRLASALPVLVLAVGLVGIGLSHDQVQIDEAADIDAALLADDLPPQAYTDPGFEAFLKSGQRL